MHILGISEEHDAGAGLVSSGKILSAINEERLNREKFYTGFPGRSIIEVLKLSGIRASDIDIVTLASTMHVPGGWLVDLGKANFARFSARFMDFCGISRFIFGNTIGCEITKNIYKLSNLKRIPRIRKKLVEIGIDAPIFTVDHHYAHACSTYFTSGWGKCLVITLDAAGDGYCSKVYLGEGNRLSLISKVPFFHSPGYYYAAATFLMGFKAGREGKVMGLAAAGDSQKTIPIFQKRIALDPGRNSFMNKGGLMPGEIEFFRRKFADMAREDIAAGIQRHLENIVVAYVKKIFGSLGIKRIRLALAGGVFANVSLNKRLSELDEVEDIFIHPHMGDGGLALGSTFAFQPRFCDTQKHDKVPRPIAFKTPYLGNIYSNEAVESILRAGNLNYKRSQNIEKEIAGYLVEGNVVARFNGAMEYGPRALGNRSILYQATDRTVNDWLNRRLGRSEFMPFAPVVMEGFEDEYFMDIGSKKSALPFMTIACDTTEKCKREVPAIVHLDGTARPQIVSREKNESYFEILRNYHEKTGIPVLINTSFNMHEEPIVSSPEEAVSAFKRGHLDILAIGSFLVEKQGNF